MLLKSLNSVSSKGSKTVRSSFLVIPQNHLVQEILNETSWLRDTRHGCKNLGTAYGYNGNLLSYYPHIKFLGITFDNRMIFRKHFEEILECCDQNFHQLRILVNKKRGLSPTIILQIYKQCVRPIFEYWIISTLLFRNLSLKKYKESRTLFLGWHFVFQSVCRLAFYMRLWDCHMSEIDSSH